MKPSILWACFLMTAVLTGCSTPQEKMDREYEQTYKRQMDEKMLALDERLKNNSDYQNLELKTDELEITNNFLHRSNAILQECNVALQNTNSIILNEVSNYQNCLAINNYIQENKKSLIREFQEQWTTNCVGLFSAVGGNGQVLKFEVDDIFLYNEFVVVDTIYVWSNNDGSGGEGRVAVYLDPAKDFNVSDCQMLGQVLISQNELAVLTGSGDSAQSRQIEENNAANIPEKPKSWVSDETKNFIVQKAIGAGIDLLVAGIAHQMNSPSSGGQPSSMDETSGGNSSVDQPGGDQ